MPMNTCGWGRKSLEGRLSPETAKLNSTLSLAVSVAVSRVVEVVSFSIELFCFELALL